MASKVYDDKLLGQILSELTIKHIQDNPTVNPLQTEIKLKYLEKLVEELMPKNYNRLGKIISMQDGLFLKLNVTNRANFIDKDIDIYLNGVITILQDGDVTVHYDIYAHIIIPSTFIMQQGRKTPVVITCTEDTYTLFKAFIARIVTYNGEYYIQFQFPYVTEQVDEAQDIDIRVYVENEQLTLENPEDPSAVAVESTCKEIPFGATPNHDPIINADKLVRSDIVRYLTISDTDHIIEDLEKTDPEHLIFRKENYITDPTLPPDQQPMPNMVNLSVKYNDSIIWTKDYDVNHVVSNGDIALSPLEGFTLEGLYNKPLTDPSKTKIVYPLTLNESKVYYANYIQATMNSEPVLARSRSARSVSDEYYTFNTRDEFDKQINEILSKNNNDLSNITFIFDFVSDLRGLLKDLTIVNPPKEIIINSDFIDFTSICENLTVTGTNLLGLQKLAQTIMDSTNSIDSNAFKNITIESDKSLEKLLRYPIRVLLIDRFDNIIESFIYAKGDKINLCKHVPYMKYSGVYLDKNYNNQIRSTIKIPQETSTKTIEFYLKDYDKDPIIINTLEDYETFKQKCLTTDLSNDVVIFSPNFKSKMEIDTISLPKSIYFAAFNKCNYALHLIKWNILKPTNLKLEHYFDMIYNLEILGSFIDGSKLDNSTLIYVDFSNSSVMNIKTLYNTFGKNVVLTHNLSMFISLVRIESLFRHYTSYDETFIKFNPHLLEIIGLFYNPICNALEVPQAKKYTTENLLNQRLLYVYDLSQTDNISLLKFGDTFNNQNDKLIEFKHTVPYKDYHSVLLDDDYYNGNPNAGFVWNVKKDILFKALNFNVNVGGYLETEFTLNLNYNELLDILNDPTKLDILPNAKLRFYNNDFNTENILDDIYTSGVCIIEKI